MGTELEDGVAELFTLDPGEFVAARDALAARLRAGGDAPAARQVKGLRRPTVSAWVANLLAREEADSVAQLVELGEALRAAHQTLSAEELRPLAAQRTAVVEALTRRAARLAAEHDHPTTEAVRAEVAQTLQAALADPTVAEQLTSGRLTRAVSYSGFGLVETPDPVPVAAPVASLAEARKKRLTRQEREAEQARVRAFGEARRALDAATVTLERAEGAAGEAEEAHLAAAEELDRHSQEVADLRAELEAAERAEDEAREAARATQQRVTEALAAVEQAEGEHEEAQRRLDELAEP